MKILMLGDVTDPRAASYLKEKLIPFRQENGIDFVTVNAENAGFIGGANPELAELLFHAGADVLTGGNHTMQTLSAHAYMDAHPMMLRPVNYPSNVPGAGYVIAEARGYRVLVISALGNAHMQPILDNPFLAVDKVLSREEGHFDLSLLDFHASETGEKLAMGRHLDGRITVVAGTHTHVPTADATILPGGTGYVTDLGMCGPTDGIIGVRTDVILTRCVIGLPARFEPATGTIAVNGVVFTVNTANGKAEQAVRVTF